MRDILYMRQLSKDKDGGPAITKQELQEMILLKELIKSPTHREAFLKAVVGDDKTREYKTPSAWQAVPPYYKEAYGLEMKSKLDKLVEDGSDIVIPWKSAGLSRTSLYLRVTQSIAYLIDKLDTPDGKYKAIRARMWIFREKNGIRLSLSRVRVNLLVREVRKMKANGEVTSWKTKLAEFIEDSQPGELLHLQHLILDDESKEYVNTLLTGVDDFRFIVTDAELKVARL